MNVTELCSASTGYSVLLERYTLDCAALVTNACRQTPTNDRMPIPEHILLAAARHFADHGYEATKLRYVLRDIGMHIRLRRYHKGLKHTLYRAAVKRYLEPVCTERLARLAQIDQALPTTHRVRALLRAYVAPHLHLCADPAAAYYLRLKARLGSEPRVIVNELFAEFIDPVRDQYLQALGDVLSIHAMDDRLIRAFGGTVLLMAGMPCDVFHGSMAGRDHVPIVPAVLIDKVVVMGTASFLHIPASRRLKKPRYTSHGTVVPFPVSRSQPRSRSSG